MDKTTWLNEVIVPPAQPPLEGEILTEVAIIGGGLAGTLSAYLLGKAGKKVVVLDKGDISNTTTAYTTAWLNCVIDTDLHDLVKMYTSEGAKNIWGSGMDAISMIEKIAREEKIDCDFSRVSHFRYAASFEEMENLEKEHAVATELGFETFLHDDKLLSWTNFGALELKNQAKFHPIKFLIGLRKAAVIYGAVFYEHTEALDITGDKTITITTRSKNKSGKVIAEYSITATYKPFNNPPELFAHTGTYTSYVLEANIPAGIVPEGLYEDEKNPYHYFRIDKNKDMVNSVRMILGGEDHRKEIPISEDRNFRSLKSYLRELLPNVSYEIKRQWSGSIIETIDGLAYIGRYSKRYKNRFLATGFSGNGMTYSAIASRIISDMILQKRNPYTSLYLASRKATLYNLMKKGIDFTGEFLGGFVKNIFK